jgi:integrase
VPGWPPIAIPLPKRRDTYTLPWEAFAPSLKADVDAYLDRLSGADLLAETPFRPVRRSTRDYRERQLRTFASALVRRGHDPATLRSLADIVALEAFKDGLRYLLERRGGASSVSIEHMATTLKAVARHWVKLDAATLDRMAAIIGKLAVKKRTMTEKNRMRLRSFDDPDNVLALLRLPERLMREAESGRHSPRRAALLAQTAIALEILIMAPIRLNNLATLDLDRHLIRPGQARHQLHVVFPESEVKNDVALDYPLPEESVALIECYVTAHRPRLAAPENRALFPGQRAATKSTSMLRSQIAKAVFTYTGLRVHPHLFRHIGAKLHLDHHPGNHSVVSRVLGHKSIDTTMAYYAGMETAAAARYFAKTMTGLRRSATRERE